MKTKSIQRESSKLGLYSLGFTVSNPMLKITQFVLSALLIVCLLDCSKENKSEKIEPKKEAIIKAPSSNGNGYLQNLVVSKETMKSIIKKQDEINCFNVYDLKAAFDLADEMKIFKVSRNSRLIYSTKNRNEILSLRNSILITETKKCQTCLCDFEKIIYLYKNGTIIIDINIVDRKYIRYGESTADAPLDYPKVFEKWFIDRKMTLRK